MTEPPRAALAFIFVTVALDMLALGLIIPVLPSLIGSFLGGDAADTSRMLGLFGTAWAAMQFFAMSIAGALSDRFGRRPVVLLSNLGNGLDYLLMALAPSLWLLFLGRLISGVTSASISTAYAYIADVLPPERRAKGFGLLGVAFGLGFVLGPAVGGLLGSMDPRLPFWVAGGLALLNFAYGWFVLPESLPPDRRAPFRWRRANPVGSLALLRQHPGLLGLAGVHFVSQLAHVVLPSITVLYATYRYGWSEASMGLALAAVGVCSAVVQGGMVGPVVKRLGERRAMALGMFCGALGFAGYGLAPSGFWFMAALPFVALWGVGGPALQSLMSRRVPADAQGRLQGAASSVQGLAQLLGPTLFAGSFALSIDRGWGLPGAPFLLSGALLLGGLALGWRVTRPRAGDPPTAPG
jgi:DHA1 family tetracycline resistance protein-like MFS transporter